MRTRAELKQYAKDAFRRNYVAAVIVSLILAVVTATGAANAGREGADASVLRDYDHQAELSDLGENISHSAGQIFDRVSHSPLGYVFAFVSVTVMIVIIAGLLLFGIFVGNVLEIGCKEFYLRNMNEQPGVGTVLNPFRSGYYWNCVKIMFCRNLFVALWSLLFVIPGIVKYYEYYAVPYLLAEFPDMTREEAFRRSREIMTGYKMEAFVLDLSFFLWLLLSAATVHIAGVFYVNPYIDATHAEFYNEITTGAVA